MAHNCEYHAGTIQYHFVREQVKRNIKLVYQPTNDMLADMMTKPLAKERHWRICEETELRTKELESSQSGSVENTGKIPMLEDSCVVRPSQPKIDVLFLHYVEGHCLVGIRYLLHCPCSRHRQMEVNFTTDIDIHDFIDCTVNECNGTKLVTSKAFPNHLKYSTILLSALYILGSIFFLLRLMSEYQD